MYKQNNEICQIEKWKPDLDVNHSNTLEAPDDMSMIEGRNP